MMTFTDDDLRRRQMKLTLRRAHAPLLDPFQETTCIGVAPLSGEHGTYNTVKALAFGCKSFKSLEVVPSSFGSETERCMANSLSRCWRGSWPVVSWLVAARLSGAPCAGENWAHLAESVYKAFLQQSIPAQVCQPVLTYSLNL